MKLILVRLLGIGERRLVGLEGCLGLVLSALKCLLAAGERALRRGQVCLCRGNRRGRAGLRGHEVLLGAVERGLGCVDLRL
ncbi:MAG: hypothetical protein LC797_08565 [Chloroflexi bacterium]|nr:hypothetical protein [Chloroflexota bacterium]